MKMDISISQSGETGIGVTALRIQSITLCSPILVVLYSQSYTRYCLKLRGLHFAVTGGSRERWNPREDRPWLNRLFRCIFSTLPKNYTIHRGIFTPLLFQFFLSFLCSVDS